MSAVFITESSHRSYIVPGWVQLTQALLETLQNYFSVCFSNHNLVIVAAGICFRQLKSIISPFVLAYNSRVKATSKNISTEFLSSNTNFCSYVWVPL